MSWDVMVFKFAEPIKVIDDNSKGLPLGHASDVRTAISAAFPGVDWSDQEWGIFDGEGFSIEFNLGDDDPVKDMMLHIRGGGSVVKTISEMGKKNKWTLLDCTTGNVLDNDNPSDEGWVKFQEFRDRVIRIQSKSDER